MKNFFKKYNKYMIGPMIYKTLTRLMIGAILCLLWAKYGNTSGHFTVLNYPFFILGVTFSGLLWKNYLQLDGVGGGLVSAREALGILFKRRKEEKKYKGISDYANQERREDAEEFDGLSDEEKLMCAMAANFFSALFFLLPSIAVSIM